MSETLFSFDYLIEKEISDDIVDECFHRFTDIGCDGLTFKTFTTLLELLFVNGDKTAYHIPIQWRIDLFNLFDINKDNIISLDEFRLMWKNWINKILKPKSALIIVDVQNDFLCGNFAMNEAEQVIPPINKLIDSIPFDLIVYSLDWHPSDHISFFENLEKRKYSTNSESDITVQNNVQLFDTVIFDGLGEQRLWPTHCVENTWGSELHKDLKLGKNSVLVYKGTNSNIDSYSAFWDNRKISETNLNQELERMSITDTYVCGVAYDICVGSTALHSIEYGYRTVLVDDACRGVCSQTIDEVKNKLCDNKAVIVDSSKVDHMVKGIDRRPQLGYVLAFKGCKK